MTHISFDPRDKYLSFEELDSKYPNEMWAFIEKYENKKPFRLPWNLARLTLFPNFRKRHLKKLTKNFKCKKYEHLKRK